MTVWDDARSVIAEGESELALDLIETALKGRMGGALNRRARELFDTVLILRAQGRRLETGVIQGTIDPGTSQAERSRRDRAIISLISEVERMDALRPPQMNQVLPERFLSEKLMGTESQLRSTGWLAEGLRA
jgi:hypothetical protein